MSDGWEDSQLYRDWDRAVNQRPYNDFVIAVSASSRTPVSGTGKTTLLTKLGQRCDQSSGGFDAEEKATLDAGKLAYDLAPNLESRSAIVGDEMQGAAGTTGMDRRRGMKSEVIDSINAILNNRDKNYTVILGAQRLNMLDSRIPPLVDAWLLIRRAPGQEGGPLGTYHRIYVEDYNFGSPQIKTPAVEDFTWEAVRHDDPDYQALEAMKQRAKQKDYGEDSDDEESGKSPKQRRDERIRSLYQKGVKQDVLAEEYDLNQSTVSRIISTS